MFDDISPSVLSRNATQASKPEEAAIGEAELAPDEAELALDDADEVVVLEDDGAGEVVVVEDADAGGDGGEGGGGGCGSDSGVAWNPAGGMVRTWPITSMYGAARVFSSTTAYQGHPNCWPTDDTLSPGCTVYRCGGGGDGGTT
jgi:hypothetical protein